MIAEIEINTVEVNGDFKCKCGKTIPFQTFDDEIDRPECTNCGIEYRVSVDGDIANLKVTVEPNHYVAKMGDYALNGEKSKDQLKQLGFRVREDYEDG